MEPEHPELSIVRQCELLGLARSTFYSSPARESEENLRLMRLLDEQYLRTPFYGSRRMALWLSGHGQAVNRKRVQRLMRVMGIEALYPGRKTTVRGAGHKIYPYLLRDVAITRVDQVWSADITYVPLRQALCTWWRSSTGLAAMCFRGGCRTAWRRRSAWRRWKKP